MVKKSKAIPVTGCIKDPKFFRQLVALCAGYTLPQKDLLVLISARGWVNPRAIVRLTRLDKLKKFNDTVTRTSDLLACSIAPIWLHAHHKNESSTIKWQEKGSIFTTWRLCPGGKPLGTHLYGDRAPQFVWLAYGKQLPWPRRDSNCSSSVGRYII
jgi:hypothetical protein